MVPFYKGFVKVLYRFKKYLVGSKRILNRCVRFKKVHAHKVPGGSMRFDGVT